MPNYHTIRFACIHTHELTRSVIEPHAVKSFILIGIPVFIEYAQLCISMKIYRKKITPGSESYLAGASYVEFFS